jgi:PadR family transcriptional regulator AphA
VNELVFKFMWEQTETVIRWATWAEEHVASWPDDIDGPTAQETGALLRQAARGG